MTTVQQEPDLVFSGSEYRDLYASSDATPFQHPLWLEQLYATLAPAVGAEPLVITGRDEGAGKLQFVLPLVRIRGRGVHRVEFADLGVSDYAAPVIAGGATDAVGDSRTHAAVLSAIGRADLVRVDKVADDATSMASVFGATKVRAHPYETHRIMLDTTFDAWRAALEPGFVRHLDRRRKRLRANGRMIRTSELTSTTDIDDAFDAMRAFRKARFADRRAIDLVQDDRYFAFYRDVARLSAASGGPGSTSALTVNDEIVAVDFTLGDDQRDIGLLIGYDVLRFRNYALGLLFSEDLIANSFANGKSVHDLTMGHDGYKKSFGATPAPMYSVRVPLTTRGRLAQAGADQNTNARRLAKHLLAVQQRRFPKLRLRLPGR